MPKSKPPIKAGSNPEAKRSRAAARAKTSALSRSARGPRDPRITEMEETSVSPATAKEFKLLASEFDSWALLNGLTVDEKNLDSVAVQYLQSIYDDGESNSLIRDSLYGIAYVRGLAKSRGTLPRCRRWLEGMRKDNPDTSQDPIPEEAFYLLLDQLCDDAPAASDPLPFICAGAAAAVQFDLMSRPSETLEIRPAQILEPQGAEYPDYAVVFAPSVIEVDGVRTPSTKTTKGGNLDDTVFAGLDPNVAALSARLLAALKTQARSGEAVFAPLTLAAYESTLRSAAVRAELEMFSITPHTVRHTSASVALYKGLLQHKGCLRVVGGLHSRPLDGMRKLGFSSVKLR